MQVSSAEGFRVNKTASSLPITQPNDGFTGNGQQRMDGRGESSHAPLRCNVEAVHRKLMERAGGEKVSGARTYTWSSREVRVVSHVRHTPASAFRKNAFSSSSSTGKSRVACSCLCEPPSAPVCPCKLQSAPAASTLDAGARADEDKDAIYHFTRMR